MRKMQASDIGPLFGQKTTLSSFPGAKTLPGAKDWFFK
jgi:hypothetical protein